MKQHMWRVAAGTLASLLLGACASTSSTGPGAGGAGPAAHAKSITLYDANGAPLPFHYSRGHAPYVTAAAPVTVTLRAGASAWVLVAKYRCDIGIAEDATTIRITLPGAQHTILTGRASSDGTGVSVLSYCRGGVNDPGQTVAISPIELAVQATG